MSVPVVGLFLCPHGRERADIDTCHYFVLFLVPREDLNIFL